MREINADGVVHADRAYPLDVLIYATGFQWMATSTFNMREGETLTGKWTKGGTRTFGCTASFPNLMIMSAHKAAAAVLYPDIDSPPNMWCGCCPKCAAGRAVDVAATARTPTPPIAGTPMC